MADDETPPRTLEELLVYSKDLRIRADQLAEESAKFTRHIQEVEKVAAELAQKQKAKRP